MASIKDVKKEWDIPKRGELRLEVSFNETASIKLLNGYAEIFGMEMSTSREYEISGAKIAVYSWEGARVAVKGICDVEYTSEETVMHVYLNTHLAIEGMRNEAVSKLADAPRILVVGASRNTVCRILVNYAVKAGRTPLFVDLDVANGSILFPGVVSAIVVDKPVDVEEGYGGDGSGSQPIAYFFGSLAVTDNAKLYRKFSSRLAFAVNSRLASMNDTKKSGAIICAPADLSEHQIKELVEVFRVNLVLVVGNERLHSTLTKTIQPPQDTIILKIPKSGGVVSKDPSWRRASQQAALHRYFYGRRQEFSPFTSTLSFDEINIRKLGEDLLAPKSALPMNATRKLDESKASAKVEPSSANILYNILAVSQAPTEEALADSNVAGFIHVTSVDDAKKQITIQSTCPGKLPSTYLIIGNISWLDNK